MGLAEETIYSKFEFKPWNSIWLRLVKVWSSAQNQQHRCNNVGKFENYSRITVAFHITKPDSSNWATFRFEWVQTEPPPVISISGGNQAKLELHTHKAMFSETVWIADDDYSLQRWPVNANTETYYFWSPLFQERRQSLTEEGFVRAREQQCEKSMDIMHDENGSRELTWEETLEILHLRRNSRHRTSCLSTSNCF